MVFCILLVIWDLLILGWLVGNFTALVVAEKSEVEELREDLAVTSHFAMRKKVPDDISTQMMEHAKLKHEVLSKDLAFLSGFPPSIRNEVKHSMLNLHVARTYLFCGCSQPFMKMLVSQPVALPRT